MSDIIIGTEGLNQNNLLELYTALGWSKYTENPAALYQAVLNSTYVVTIRNGEKILGLARSLSDDVAIHYLQDILVLPEYQRQGVGRKLMESCLQRFAHVRTHLLLTDDEKRQRLFYESVGFVNTREITKFPLNCYVKMDGVELE